MSSDDAEILRLRDRVHALGNDVIAMQFQVNDLREWRAENRGLLTACREDLDKVIEAQELAAKMARERTADRDASLTRREKMIALAVALLAALSPHVGWHF